ncbi:hypothetical protein CPB84DRAFT_1820846 [Gymnopilus junonius]|uniref:Uncharacterized protein n=1 Tax=Gymnopilus junonius TaxID=109634 RepID=A0A9P5P088_GYMJU|nr:hypothetical protein CPB84DRAFT_1820846 [Gymnopilus junonius]
MSHQRWVVVDDTDPSIHYTGPWFADTSGSQDNIGNYGPSYQSTLHGTKQDASFSFAFTGSKVTIFGSNNRVNSSGTLDPTWNCFVDGVATGPTAYFQYPENNWVFCDQDSLSDGQHVITVNATVTSGHTFWFDSIQYVPSASNDLSPDAILVDNHDADLQFGSGWGSLGGSANMTTVSNSIFTYEWTGVSLSWYGFIPAELPLGQTTGSYAVDGGNPTSFLLKGIPPNTATLYNQKFFQTPNFPAGPHKIVVTYLGNGQVTPLTLDYLIVQNGSVPNSSSSSSSSSSSGGGSSSPSGGSSSSGTTSGSPASQPSSAHGTSPSGAAASGVSSNSGGSNSTSSSPSNSGSSSSGSSSSNNGSSGSGSASNNSSSEGSSGSNLASSSSTQKSNTGPIVGGIVGALVLIALAVVAFLLYRKKNKKIKLDRAYGAGGPLNSGSQANFVEPFQYSPVQTSPPPTMLSGGVSYGLSGYNNSSQHMPLPQNSPTNTLSYVNNAGSPTTNATHHGSMPSYTTTDLHSAITSATATSLSTGGLSAGSPVNVDPQQQHGYQVGYGAFPYTSEKMRREAEAVAARAQAQANANTTPLRPMRPNQQPAEQQVRQGIYPSPSPFDNSNTGSNSRLVVHEDSGIRLPPHTQGLDVVDVPPVYTPA